MPRQVALSLGQVHASALVTGLAAAAALSTVSGPLQVESHTGGLELNTVSGDADRGERMTTAKAAAAPGELEAALERIRRVL